MKTAYESAYARYQQVTRAKQSTSLVKEEQNLRLAQNEANINVARAAVDLARINLSYTVITAPCNGVLGRKNIVEGQLLQPGQVVANIVDFTFLSFLLYDRPYVRQALRRMPNWHAVGRQLRNVKNIGFIVKRT